MEHTISRAQALVLPLPVGLFRRLHHYYTALDSFVDQRMCSRNVALTLLMVWMLGMNTDGVRLDPVQRVSLPHGFSTTGWEAQNFLSKWVHLLEGLLPWAEEPSDLQKRATVLDYYQLAQEISSLGYEVHRAAAEAPEGRDRSVEALEAELATLKARRGEMRDDVEETMEGAISAVLVEEGLATWGPIIFPPVDFRLAEPPKLLVTSHRDRIETADEALLVSEITVAQSEDIEGELQETDDLSALVTGIGGLSTYPAFVVDYPFLEWTLDTAAHEWIHNYLATRLTPLSQNYSCPKMSSLEETLADIAGREIAERVRASLDGRPNSDATPAASDQPEPEDSEARFDFASEMRATRQRVDELLAGGKVEQAETYMEERRKMFVDNGHYIRKLNQAYFAFHGTYAESPESGAEVSPIADQLNQFRKLLPDLRTFVETVAGFSTYREFLNALDLRRILANSAPTP